MKIKNTIFNKAGVVISLILLFVFSTMVYGYVETDEDYRFSKEELTQMLAPIALYPDSLLSQILMASTYPLEIVEAERWLNKNKGLQGDTLSEALLEKDWDTSVKSLCHFKDVLFSLSQELEQTRRLGDAFLSQEEEVMEIIQELRRMAYDKGTLKETKEQKVVVQKEYIVIEPAKPQIVYVPIYDPLYVYGRWMYPAHTPYYWYRPYNRITVVKHIYFRRPISISVGLFTWTWFDWPTLRIYISRENAQRYHRHYYTRRAPAFYWRHNPSHRRGVTYINNTTRERFAYPINRRNRQNPTSNTYNSPTRPTPGRNIDNSGRFETRPDRNRTGRERDGRTQTAPLSNPQRQSPNTTLEERQDRNRNERERDGRTQTAPISNPQRQSPNTTLEERQDRNRNERERDGRTQTAPISNPQRQSLNTTLERRLIGYENHNTNNKITPTPYSLPRPSTNTNSYNTTIKNQNNLFTNNGTSQKSKDIISRGASLMISNTPKTNNIKEYNSSNNSRLKDGITNLFTGIISKNTSEKTNFLRSKR